MKRGYVFLALIFWLSAMVVALHPDTWDNLRLLLAIPFVAATVWAVEKSL